MTSKKLNKFIVTDVLFSLMLLISDICSITFDSMLIMKNAQIINLEGYLLNGTRGTCVLECRRIGCDAFVKSTTQKQCKIYIPEPIQDRVLVFAAADGWNLYHKNTDLEEEYLEVLDESDIPFKIYSTSRQIRPLPKLNTYVDVQSNAETMWMLFAEEEFCGESYLVKGAQMYTTFHGFTGKPIRSAQKIQGKCAERPIGVQNPAIILDDQMSNVYHYTVDLPASIARLTMSDDDSLGTHGAGSFHPDLFQAGGWAISPVTPGIGFKVELGNLHRVYSITTRGTCYCSDNTVVSRPYVWYTFVMKYSSFSDATSYKKAKSTDGNDQTFYGNDNWNNWSNFKIAKVSPFDIPVLARTVIPTETDSYYLGMRFEINGCELDDDKKVAYTSYLNQDCYGNDIAHYTLDGTDAHEECMQTCNEYHGCVGVVIVTTADESICFLKAICMEANLNVYSVADSTSETYIRESAYYNVGSDFTALDDNSHNTCYTASEITSRVRHPTPAWIKSSNITVLLHIRLQASCVVDQSTVVAYVHNGIYLRGSTGLFRGCDVIREAEAVPGEDSMYLYEFQCYCSYGICEYVFTTIKSPIFSSNSVCFSLCEVSIEDVL